jgi:hypothetical protein
VYPEREVNTVADPNEFSTAVELILLPYSQAPLEEEVLHPRTLVYPGGGGGGGVGVGVGVGGGGGGDGKHSPSVTQDAPEIQEYGHVISLPALTQTGVE